MVETLSVILQVASFKLTGKRIFLMAPLHHHFEKRLAGKHHRYPLLDYLGDPCADQPVHPEVAIRGKADMIATHTKIFNRIAILGMGRSGQAVLDACVADGILVNVFDDKGPTSRTETCFRNFNDWDMDGLEAMVISPGIPHHHPAPHPAAKCCVDAGVPIISEVEFALRRGRAGRWISITGTNGKSTTTALIGHILEKAGINSAVGGNIGAAVTALKPVGADGVNVIELSSYQLEVTPSLRSDIAVILNITPDHLDRHGGMTGYIRAKEQVLASVSADGLAVLGEGKVSG